MRVRCEVKFAWLHLVNVHEHPFTQNARASNRFGRNGKFLLGRILVGLVVAEIAEYKCALRLYSQSAFLACCCFLGLIQLLPCWLGSPRDREMGYITMRERSLPEQISDVMMFLAY